MCLQALFVASGPVFKQDLIVKPFQNIELYNLMSRIVGVEPADNNGTTNSLLHLLRVKPKLPRTRKPSYVDFDAAHPDTTNTTGCFCNAVRHFVFHFVISFIADSSKRLYDDAANIVCYNLIKWKLEVADWIRTRNIALMQLICFYPVLAQEVFFVVVSD